MHLSMRRLLTVAGIVVVASFIGVPARAHASLDKSQVPADSDQSLRLTTPVERFDGSQNQKIETLVPDGFTVQACSGPSGWTCVKASSAGGTAVTWSRGDDGTLVDMSFDMDVHTPKVEGMYLFKTIQTYSDGDEARWTNDEEPGPAPRLQVGSSSAPVKTNPPAKAHATPEPSPKGPKATSGTDAPPARAPASAAGRVDDGASPSPRTTSDGEAGPADGPADRPQASPLAAPVASEDEGGSGGLLVAAVAAVVLAGSGAGVLAYRRRQGA